MTKHTPHTQESPASFKNIWQMNLSFDPPLAVVIIIVGVLIFILDLFFDFLEYMPEPENGVKAQTPEKSPKPFVNFVRRKTKKPGANFLNALKERLHNWWENMPLQRGASSEIGLLSMPRGGSQLLTYQEFKTSIDPVFAMIHLHKLKNLLEKRKPKPANRFQRLSGVVGFGIALRILTLSPGESRNAAFQDLQKDQQDSFVRNYHDHAPIGISQKPKEVKIQVGNQILVFTKEVTTTEVPNSEGQNQSVISKTEMKKLRIKRLPSNSQLILRPKRKSNRAKLMRFSDLPKMEDQFSNEDIFIPRQPINNNRPSIRIRVE